MKNTEILLSFDDQNNPILEVIRGDGKTCTDLTKAIENALGVTTNRDFKPEHRLATNQTANRITQR
jgi:hypothetical protein